MGSASVFFFFLSANAARGTAGSGYTSIRRSKALTVASEFPLASGIGVILLISYLRVRSLWQLEQNCHVVGLIFHQQVGLALKRAAGGKIRQSILAFTFVMSAGSTTSETGWPSIGWPRPELQGQHHHFILCEIVVGQFHAAIENCEHVLGFEFLGLRIRSVALEAKGVGILRAQQMIVCRRREARGRSRIPA